MNELKYGGLSAFFGAIASVIAVFGLFLHLAGLVLLAVPSVFAAGWCAAKASWS